MKANILEAIFFDEHHNWDNFVEKYGRKIRLVVKREVNKFRYCGDIRKGYRLFVCEGCHQTKFVPLKCRGKFCPTCATGESQRWSAVVANDMFKVTHRHVIFTIDEGLREIFMMENYRDSLLKGLMDEAAKIILAYFEKRKVKAGVVATIHTFGSKLEFNPHVHMVVTMGGLTRDGSWEDYDYLPFSMLRKYWKNAVLKLIRRTLGEWDKQRVQSRLQAAYKNNGEGFYVNAPKRSRTNLKSLLQYISRYMKRGPIALSRILMYDGDTVMFNYMDKRTNTKETMTMSIDEFIAALIRHIQNKNFKTIRRYGVYSRRIKTLMKKVMKEYQKRVKKLFINLNEALRPKSWEERITEEFGENPLECSCCGEYYEFVGMSVRKNGRLVIKYAKDNHAKRFMREENRKIDQKEFRKQYEEEKEKTFKAIRWDWERQREIYMSKLW